VAALVHGTFFARIAPPAKRRRQITVPALVVGHSSDPIHPAADAAMLAEELPNARFVRARSILEWRLWPERLDHEAVEWAQDVWATPTSHRRTVR
jgi:pimeloyl-ACP methyl ester carboxylesterase